jgi:hypothetical protein
MWNNEFQISSKKFFDFFVTLKKLVDMKSSSGEVD